MNARVMVCVTGQKTCERLIAAGREIADAQGDALSVVHVARPGGLFLGAESESEALEYLYRKSVDFDADMTVLRAQNVVGTLVEYARENGVATIVLGTAGTRGDRDIARELEMLLPSVRVEVVRVGEP